MRLLYSLGIYVYLFFIRVAALFNHKAKLWIEGRKDWQKKLHAWRDKNPGTLYWFHCASLGEFEQGRPLIEAIRKENPAIKILLTFFSPSGYEIRKNYDGADLVCYLPADTPASANQFLDIIQPASVFVVKYEYWANYFFACQKRKIELFIVSGILRPDQRFFGAFSFFWKKVLQCVTHFFVQDQRTLELLHASNFHNATLTGDTRFDRVMMIAGGAKEIAEIKAFKGESLCVVAGSSWDADEKVLFDWWQKVGSVAHKLIIVPHEIHEQHLASVESRWPDAIRWTRRGDIDLTQKNVLIVDAIGFLSAIYRYADIAMIGGGFGAGIHNTLEAAVWGVPVVFGPRHEKFLEAQGLLACGGAYSGIDATELVKNLIELTENAGKRTESGKNAREFVAKNAGATKLIMRSITHHNI